MNLTPHTIDTAPDASKPILEEAKKKFGFDLNLFGVMAESPLALAAYTQLSDLVEQHAALSAEEQQVVMLTVSTRNGCEYCVAAHSTVADMQHMDADLAETRLDEPFQPKAWKKND